MAKKGKGKGDQHYDFKYKKEFEALVKGNKSEKPGKFLGFKLKTENVNQLWRWDDLSNITN